MFVTPFPNLTMLLSVDGSSAVHLSRSSKRIVHFHYTVSPLSPAKPAVHCDVIRWTKRLSAANNAVAAD